jgi:hypothetical protein
MTVLARPDVVTRLHQETYWASRHPHGHLVQRRLDDMNERHLTAVLTWLRAHAEQLHRDQIQLLLREWRRGVDRAEIEVDIAHLQRAVPAMWLEETALVRRLVQLAPPPPPRRRRRLLTALRRHR